MSEDKGIVQVSKIVQPFRKFGYLLKAAKYSASSAGTAAMVAGQPGVALMAKGAELGIGFAELVVEGIDYNAKAKKEANAATLLNLWQQGLEERVKKLEELPEKDLDLFEHVVKKALDEDEARKLPFYNAVLSWVLTGNQGVTRVKILTDAVRTLTYVELWAFCRMVGQERRTPTLPLSLTKEHFKVRVENAGLGKPGTMSSNTDPTELGNILFQFSRDERMEEPEELKQPTH